MVALGVLARHVRFFDTIVYSHCVEVLAVEFAFGAGDLSLRSEAQTVLETLSLVACGGRNVVTDSGGPSTQLQQWRSRCRKEGGTFPWLALARQDCVTMPPDFFLLVCRGHIPAVLARLLSTHSRAAVAADSALLTLLLWICGPDSPERCVDVQYLPCNQEGVVRTLVNVGCSLPPFQALRAPLATAYMHLFELYMFALTGVLDSRALFFFLPGTEACRWGR